MTQYRAACEDDRRAIDRLWAMTFPEDDENDRRRFFDTVTLTDECVVATVDGAVVSTAFLLPAVLRTVNGRLPVRYVYAAATDPRLRGQGLFGGLLRYAAAIAEADGCAALFLRPASERLARYYERHGFIPYFYAQTVTGDAAPSTVAVAPITAAEYTVQRAARLPQTAVEWEPRFLGNTVTIGDGIAVCDVRGDELYIPELLCPPVDCAPYAAALAHAYGCVRYRCRFPAQDKQQAFGWIYPIAEIHDNGVPYMGVALD